MFSKPYDCNLTIRLWKWGDFIVSSKVFPRTKFKSKIDVSQPPPLCFPPLNFKNLVHPFCCSPHWFITLCVPSKFFPTAKDIYIHPWCTLPPPTLSALQQPKTYIYILLLFHVWPKYFHVCNQGGICILHLLPQQPMVYIYILIKGLFYRCLVVRCILFWLLSYI